MTKISIALNLSLSSILKILFAHFSNVIELASSKNVGATWFLLFFFVDGLILIGLTMFDGGGMDWDPLWGGGMTWGFTKGRGTSLSIPKDLYEDGSEDLWSNGANDLQGFDPDDLWFLQGFGQTLSLKGIS